MLNLEAMLHARNNYVLACSCSRLTDIDSVIAYDCACINHTCINRAYSTSSFVSVVVYGRRWLFRSIGSTCPYSGTRYSIF